MVKPIDKFKKGARELASRFMETLDKANNDSIEALKLVPELTLDLIIAEIGHHFSIPLFNLKCHLIGNIRSTINFDKLNTIQRVSIDVYLSTKFSLSNISVLVEEGKNQGLIIETNGVLTLANQSGPDKLN